MVSRAGVRTALPKRSATINVTADHKRPATASSGTDTTVRAYPPIESAQWRPVRSEMRPVTIRNTNATASPAPETTPTTTALAPNVARYGPVTARAPS